MRPDCPPGTYPKEFVGGGSDKLRGKGSFQPHTSEGSAEATYEGTAHTQWRCERICPDGTALTYSRGADGSESSSCVPVAGSSTSAVPAPPSASQGSATRLSSFVGKWDATSSEDDKHQTFSFAGDGTLIIDPFEGRMLVGKVDVDGDYLLITDPKDPKVRVRVKAVWNGTNELSLHMDGEGKIIFLRRK